MGAATQEHRSLLVDSVRDYLAGEGLDQDAAKAAFSAERLTQVWRGCAAMGWLQACAAEARGGLGLALSDAAAMLEEVGRFLLPLPVADAVAIAAWLPRQASSQAAVAAWLQGECWLSLLRDAEAADSPSGMPHGHGAALVEFALTDAPAFHAAWSADRLALSLWPVTSPGFGVDPLIGTGRLAQNASALSQWQVDCDAGSWLHYCRARRLLRLAELMGVGAQALDIAVRHAQERVQFGKPIGVNQAIKHRLADCWMALDNARLALHDACDLLERHDSQAEAASLTAWLLTGEAAMAATGQAIQTLGALGISWECPAHFYLKRARHLMAILGREGSREDVLDRLWAVA